MTSLLRSWAPKAFLKKFVLGFLIWALYRLLSWSWRLSVDEPDFLQNRLARREPLIFAHWHGDESVLISFVKRYRIATMTSTSADGEMMNTVLHLLGAKTSRGSSTRGGVSALKGLLRLVRDGFNCSFAVDGPKGPIYKVKPGVFELARVMKVQTLLLAGVTCDRKWSFPRSWNQAYLPKPFARVHVVWQTLDLPNIDDPRDPTLASAVERGLSDARQFSSKKIAAL